MKYIIVSLLLFFSLVFPAGKAYAVVGGGPLGDWVLTDLNTPDPLITFSNVDQFTSANCTEIITRCGSFEHIYTACRPFNTCTAVFPMRWTTLNYGVPITQGHGGAIGFYFYNGTEGVYTGSTDWTWALPTPTATPHYQMSTTVKESASGLLGSMTAQLFRVIIIGIGIVAGVIVTLFGLRWLIKFVRRNLHG